MGINAVQESPLDCRPVDPTTLTLARHHALSNGARGKLHSAPCDLPRATA
jgi:hypothetical protein